MIALQGVCTRSFMTQADRTDCSQLEDRIQRAPTDQPDCGRGIAVVEVPPHHGSDLLMLKYYELYRGTITIGLDRGVSGYRAVGNFRKPCSIMRSKTRGSQAAKTGLFLRPEVAALREGQMSRRYVTAFIMSSGLIGSIYMGLSWIPGSRISGKKSLGCIYDRFVL